MIAITLAVGCLPGNLQRKIGALIMRNRFTPDTSFMSLFPCLLIYGVGLGLPSSLSVDVPLATVPPQAQNSCSGLVSTGQNLGLSMGTGIIGVVLTLGAVSGLREAINTYTPMNLSYEEFRANAEMYMQKMGHVEPLTLTVTDQSAYQKIVNAIYIKGYKEATNIVIKTT